MRAVLLRPDGTVFAEDDKCLGEILACAWARRLVDAAREPGTYRLLLRVPEKVAPVFSTVFQRKAAHA